MICVTNCGDDGLTKGIETWFKKSSNSGEKQLDFADRLSEHERRRKDSGSFQGFWPDQLK